MLQAPTSLQLVVPDYKDSCVVGDSNDVTDFGAFVDFGDFGEFSGFTDVNDFGEFSVQ